MIQVFNLKKVIYNMAFYVPFVVSMYIGMNMGIRTHIFLKFFVLVLVTINMFFSTKFYFLKVQQNLSLLL